MGPQTYNATNRVIAGGVMSVFGVALLAGAFLYGHYQGADAANPVTAPLLQSLALIFKALAGVFIVAGLFVAVQGLRRAAKARRTDIDTGFGDSGA